MNTSIFTKTAAWVGLIIAVAVAAVMVFGNLSSSSSNVGSTDSTSHQEVISWGFGAGLQIGQASQAPRIKELAYGTCTLTTANSSALPLVSTSTGQFNCAIGSNVNIAAGDLVSVSLANGHAASWGAFDVVDAIASTTDAGNNGVITVTLLNNTGVATSSFTVATSSAQYTIVRL